MGADLNEENRYRQLRKEMMMRSDSGVDKKKRNPCRNKDDPCG